MTLAAMLAGGGVFYFAKANIKAQDFNRVLQTCCMDMAKSEIALPIIQVMQQPRTWHGQARSFC
jgi:hypothetical protein